jgi:hypothetical protein
MDFNIFDVPDNKIIMQAERIYASISHSAETGIIKRESGNKTSSFYPKTYIEWAIKKELDIPQPLLDWYENQKKPVRATAAKSVKQIELEAEIKNLKAENSALKKQLAAAQAQKNELNSFERESLLKLVLGMAIDAYGYQSFASRNLATGDKKGSISVAIASRGFNIDADTIRKYIKEAEAKFSDIIGSKP